MESDFVNKKDLVVIRDYIETDKDLEGDTAFIYSTWLRGLYFGNSWPKEVFQDPRAPIDLYREIDADLFFNYYHEVIEKIISRKPTKISVCVLKEDEDVILGYSVSEPKILHWVFVKDAWRKLGIAKDLIPKDIQVITHLTKIGSLIKPIQWKFNPWLF